MEQFKRLIPYIRPKFAVLAFAIFCGVILSLIGVGTANLVKYLYDGIFERTDPKVIAMAPWALVGLYFVQGVVRFVHQYLLRFTGNEIIFKIRADLHAKYAQLHLGYYSKTETGQMLSRLFNDVTQIQGGINIIAVIIKEPIKIIGLIAYLVWVNWQLLLLTLIAVPFLVLASKSLGRSVRKYSTLWQEEMERATTALKETLDGAKVVRAFNLEDHRLGVFDKLNRRMLEVLRQIYIREEISGPLFELLAAAVCSGVLYYAGHQILAGKSSPGELVSFVYAIFAVQAPVKALQDAHIKLQHSFTSINRVFEVLDAKTEIPEPLNPVPFPENWNEIQFDHVSFAYGDRTILKDINLKIKKGELVAIVGPSGAGKSTLVNLLPRFYDVSEGHVKIQGVDIKDISVKDLRAHVGLVTQDVFLFNEPVSDNVIAGENFDRLKLESALNGAYATDFVAQMEKGSESVVGDRGTKLSGGERQRVSIARAIYKNAPILILDEATSSLDSESEKIVQKALDELMEGRTTLVIAHRLSTIQKANRILVVADGRIVEEGTHSELIGKRGMYQKLHEIQFSGGEYGI